MKTRITVTGLVQGIGFRPFVAELAEEHNLDGQVKNLGGIVEIMISGNKKAVDSFIHRLSFVSETKELPGCRIDALQIEEVSDEQWYQHLEHSEDTNSSFLIVQSSCGSELRRFLPVDLSICDRCAMEMQDKKNRRYRYPFISCTACGPRFSIQKAVPYDRESITMDVFPMCSDCMEEYEEKGNIRRHAQTIACKSCGPMLRYLGNHYEGSEYKENTKTAILEECDANKALQQAIADLNNGKIGTIKDIGGYHFACSVHYNETVKRLREFKNRDKKPFAVMFPNIESVKEYCEVLEQEEALLCSPAKPIVLLNKKKDFVSEICGESDRIGALLPCNPLQILLLEETGPLVMTSGNRGGEPIIISETEMEPYVKSGAIDFMLTHDRAILTPLDDSIYQVMEFMDATNECRSVKQLIRRARGIVPEPMVMKRALKQDTFAAGGDLKAVFALGREQLVYLSQYFGDLEDVRCMESRIHGRQRMEALLDIKPERSLGDMHPAYVSAQDMQVKIQHHHAHVASVIAEHGLEGKVLGVACDGTGFGTDGTIWGSEFLLCEDADVIRMGHFSKVKLVGGDASAKQADMTLYSYMLQARENGLDTHAYFSCVRAYQEYEQARQLQEMAWTQNINTVDSTSMGRLFDAAAALLEVCGENSYEGECAMKLEQMAHKGMREWLQNDSSIEISMKCEKQDNVWVADSLNLLIELGKLKQDYSKELLAYLFHHAVADGIVQITEQICKECNVKQVALSGGTFINRIILREVMEALCQKGLAVYINEKIPCGDGGIALGQIYLSTFY